MLRWWGRCRRWGCYRSGWLHREFFLVLTRWLMVVLLIFWVQPLSGLLQELFSHVFLPLLRAPEPTPLEIWHMQHLVTHAGEEPVLELCVCCVPPRIGIE